MWGSRNPGGVDSPRFFDQDEPFKVPGTFWIPPWEKDCVRVWNHPRVCKLLTFRSRWPRNTKICWLTCRWYLFQELRTDKNKQILPRECVTRKTKQNKPAGCRSRALDLNHSSASYLCLREGPTASLGLSFFICKVQTGFLWDRRYEGSTGVTLTGIRRRRFCLLQSDLLMAQFLHVRNHHETFLFDSLESKMTPFNLTSWERKDLL